MNDLHQILTSMPLLQGIDGIELNHLLEREYVKRLMLDEGDIWVYQGTGARHLAFLAKGQMNAETQSADGRYTFTESFVAPTVIEPEVLYGIQRTFGSTYKAVSECQLLLIAKEDVNRMVSTNEVFRINYFNLLSTLAIRRRKGLMPIPVATLADRLRLFFRSHATEPKGPISFHIRMSDLAQYTGTTRSLVSNALHHMENEGLLSVSRSNIVIPKIEKM